MACTNGSESSLLNINSYTTIKVSDRKSTLPNVCDHFEYKTANKSTTDTIFFLETLPTKRTLGWRHVCALESAARHNPQSKVLLLHPYELYKLDFKYKFLVDTFNIHIEQIKERQPFEGSLMENWYDTNIVEKSGKWRPVHMSDALRLAILWVCGGTYLDTDVIVLRPLPRHPAWIGMGIETSMNTALLSFSEKKHELLGLYMDLFVNKYDLEYFNGNDGYKLEDSYVKMINSKCNTSFPNFADYIRRNTTCIHDNEVVLLSANMTSPLPYLKVPEYFSESNMTDTVKDAYAIHYFNDYTFANCCRRKNGKIMDQVFETYCPGTYQLMKDEDVWCF